MRSTVNRFVVGVAAAAVIHTAALASMMPTGAEQGFSALVFLAALAVLAELLAFFLAAGAKGSIAFIPYMAAVFVVPSWMTVVVVAGVKLGSELLNRNVPIRAVFNSSQHALATGVAVSAYVSLGGQSLLELTNEPLSVVSLSLALPAVVALTAAFFTNSLLVSGVLAISSGRKLREAWKEVHLPSVGVDLLATPVVFIFAWVYAKYGPIAASALWVPILGLRQLNKINAELDRMNRELLQLMVKSIEARDPYTSGHSRRVEHFAILIARAVGLSDKETKRVGQAALLHDVGKIHEKYAPILLKQDRLTPSEWATIQQHPADGAELVATMTQLKDLVPAIRHHHERWDGAGYPDGIAGDMIPYTARIISLADTIDAMTSERPYRPAMTEEDVRKEIVRGRGTQFDPTVVDRLMMDGAWKTIFAPVHERRAKYGDLHLVVGATH